ncbi:hypothetical protein ACIGBH_39565 [Streptomyces sp. NPDC085929]|uniref:hypothetical protein n=1 Tax=Streptomyces sp. NPDC085929 TaxID=3365739 RepID=UPI0037D295E1
MVETSLPYSRAAHHLDRLTAEKLGGRAPMPPQLHVVPFDLSFTVPAEADRSALAQALADQLHTLRREEAGEEYEGRVDVVVPAGNCSPGPSANDLSSYLRS